MKAVYIALSQTTQEAVWLKRLLEELGKPEQDPTVIYEDNQGEIAAALYQKTNESKVNSGNTMRDR